MGFWDTTWDVLDAVGKAVAAQAEAERLLTLSRSVARRQLKVASKDAEDGQLQRLIDALDRIARTGGDGERVEFAAELAEYGDTLL